MVSEEKRVWGIHTQDDHLFLHGNVVAIGWKEIQGNWYYFNIDGSMLIDNI